MTSIAGAGSLDGDAHDDLVTGIPSENGSSGKVAVFMASSGSMNAGSAPGSSLLLAGTSGLSLGASVAMLPNMDHDAAGTDELMAGAPGYSSAAGAAYVLFGNSTYNNSSLPTNVSVSAIPGTNAGLVIFNTAANEQAGFSVASAGDQNGDGIIDMLIGAPGDGVGMPGKVYVVYGQSTAGTINLSTLAADGKGYVITGVAGDRLGASVASGHIQGNAAPELLLGAPNAATGGGRVYAIKGGLNTSINVADLLDTQAVIFEGGTAGDAVGTSEAVVGDFNANGLSDILIGAPGVGGGGGAAYLIYNMNFGNL